LFSTQSNNYFDKHILLSICFLIPPQKPALYRMINATSICSFEHSLH
jgi:hypothetical protein